MGKHGRSQRARKASANDITLIYKILKNENIKCIDIKYRNTKFYAKIYKKNCAL